MERKGVTRNEMTKPVTLYRHRVLSLNLNFHRASIMMYLVNKGRGSYDQNGLALSVLRIVV